MILKITRKTFLQYLPLNSIFYSKKLNDPKQGPKWIQNEAKRDVISVIFMPFSKRAKSVEMLCFAI